MRTALSTVAMLALAAGLCRGADRVDYLRDVKPIFSQNCYSCHGPQKQRSGLRLDNATLIRKGGNSGPAIVPGKSRDSRLWKAINGVDDTPQMPPKGDRLKPEQITVLKAWIDQGAQAPANEASTAGSAQSKHWAFHAPVRGQVPEPAEKAWVRNPIDAFILSRLEKEKLRPSAEADKTTLIRRVSLDLTGLPPSVAEVDSFLADTRLDAYEHLVDRLLQSPHYGERWARHWLDLARYADSNGFTIDGARPMWKYRDWVIDAFNRDLPFDQFTIDQIAGDLLVPALAPSKGGALKSPTDVGPVVTVAANWSGEDVARLIATGFHRNTLKNEEGGIDLEQFRVESVVDRINTTGSVFLGLTVGCCQCHDHKFDPLTQREYYQFFAFFNGADEPTLEVAKPEQLRQRRQIHDQIAVLEQQRKAIDFTSAASEEAWEKRLTREQRLTLPADIQAILEVPENGRTVKQKETLTTAYRKRDMVNHLVGAIGGALPYLPAAQSEAVLFRLSVEKRVVELKNSEPAITSTLVMVERPSPRPTTIHIQGDFTRKGVPVERGTPAVLHPLRAATVREREDNRSLTVAAPNRLDLARWLVDPANPLTARVTVNRYWQHFFGLGLVETENDFGTQGTPPSHPDLLDWLATEFIARKWSVKAIHRLMVTSATYRQTSHARPDLAAVDPRNRLLARQSRLRLEAEVVRDVALAAGGLLNPEVGGPSVFPPQPDGVYAFTQINKNWKTEIGPDRYRRGMYTYFWRSAPHPGLTVFDAPDANSACTCRNRSNTPLQALTLLNDQSHLEFAQGLAARVLKVAAPSDGDRLRHAFRLCLGRAPRDFEHKRLGELLAQQRAGFEAAPDEARLLVPVNRPAAAPTPEYAAWVAVARVLLNLDEFITRE